MLGSLDDEYPTLLTKMNMPFMYAKRAMISTYYTRNEPQNKLIITANSSILNEQLLHGALNDKIAYDSQRDPRSLITD